MITVQQENEIKDLKKVTISDIYCIMKLQLYEESSFLRRPDLSSFLSHILEAMEDISVPVDPAMKKTLEQHYRI